MGNFLEKEKEQEEIEKLIAEDIEEENNPDWQQYGFLKWRKN
jgi:hypothetical protein